MKKIISLSIITFLFCASKIAAQKDSKDSIKYFVVLYSTGEAWDTAKQFYDQKYFDDHSKFLSGLRKNKTIVTGGRYSDKGMLILKSKNEKTARSIMEGDVSVKNKTFRFELFELDVFYEGCIELQK